MKIWEYSEAKPYPEELDTVVSVKLRNGLVLHGYTVGFWNKTFKPGQSNWKQVGSQFDIVEYNA